jgi:RNA polymerase sigma factor (sigma-70 family)
MKTKAPIYQLLKVFAARRAEIASSVYGRVRNAAVVDDVMQDAWLKIAGAQTGGDIKNPEAFVRSIARNAAIDVLRKERRRAVIDEEVNGLIWESEDECSPERILMGREAIAAALQVIETLPEQTRRIFAMNRFEGKTHREIAAELGISEPAVFYHIRRVLERLADVRGLFSEE